MKIIYSNSKKRLKQACLTQLIKKKATIEKMFFCSTDCNTSSYFYVYRYYLLTNQRTCENIAILLR